MFNCRNMIPWAVHIFRMLFSNCKTALVYFLIIILNDVDLVRFGSVRFGSLRHLSTVLCFYSIDALDVWQVLWKCPHLDEWPSGTSGDWTRHLDNGAHTKIHLKSKYIPRFRERDFFLPRELMGTSQIERIHKVCTYESKCNVIRMDVFNGIRGISLFGDCRYHFDNMGFERLLNWLDNYCKS